MKMDVLVSQINHKGLRAMLNLTTLVFNNSDTSSKVKFFFFVPQFKKESCMHIFVYILMAYACSNSRKRTQVSEVAVAECLPGGIQVNFEASEL